MDFCDAVESPVASPERPAGDAVPLVTLTFEDALSKIQSLKGEIVALKGQHAEELESLRDQLTTARESHLASHRRILQDVRAREALLLESLSEENHKARYDDIRRELEIAFESERLELREKLRLRDMETIELRRQLQDLLRLRDCEHAEAKLSQQLAVRNEEEVLCLKNTIATLRGTISQLEREAADRTSAEEWNMAMAEKHCMTVRALEEAEAEAKVWSGVVQELRHSLGKSLVDAVLLRFVRTSQDIAATVDTGIDVAHIISSKLDGVDLTRAVANLSAFSPSLLPPPGDGPSLLPSTPSTPDERGMSPVADVPLLTPNHRRYECDATAFVERARKLHRDAQRLRRSQSVESFRWSPSAPRTPAPNRIPLPATSPVIRYPRRTDEWSLDLDSSHSRRGRHHPYPTTPPTQQRRRSPSTRSPAARRVGRGGRNQLIR
eukprot:Sspe_Gene.39219::Locus_18923_Transcript_2_2_Confidence_0.667_Length_1475::g.39219::m.39219